MAQNKDSYFFNSKPRYLKKINPLTTFKDVKADIFSHRLVYFCLEDIAEEK